MQRLFTFQLLAEEPTLQVCLFCKLLFSSAFKSVKLSLLQRKWSLIIHTRLGCPNSIIFRTIPLCERDIIMYGGQLLYSERLGFVGYK